MKTSGRCDRSASHKIKIKYSKAVNDIVDPIDEIMFHVV